MSSVNMGEIKLSNGHTGNQPPELSPDLEKRMIEQFDDLVAKGEISWAPFTSEPIEVDGYKAVFQRCPHLRKKPMQHHKDRKTGKGSNPFLNPDPNFIVTHINNTHTLLLNKYCVYRPSLVLHTNEFIPQSSDLDQSDITAAWKLLRHIQTPYMMIYNCGINSGSSQGHKHMQLWPTPTREEIGFDLFPSQAKSRTEIASAIPNVPHRHFALRLPKDATPEVVLTAYQKLLTEIEKCHEKYGSTAYNVAMTQDWLCLIPRRTSGGSKGAGSNAAGVLGLIWIIDDIEKAIWQRPTLGEFLGDLGLPVDKEVPKPNSRNGTP